MYVSGASRFGNARACARRRAASVGGRHLAVGGLADEPRPAVDGVEMFVPVRRAGARVVVGAAADTARPRLRAPCALDHELLHLLGPELAALLAGEVVGALERRAVLVLVRVRAFDSRVAPRGARQLRRSRGGLRRRVRAGGGEGGEGEGSRMRVSMTLSPKTGARLPTVRQSNIATPVTANKERRKDEPERFLLSSVT